MPIQYLLSVAMSLGVMLWARWYVTRSINETSDHCMKQVMPDGWKREHKTRPHVTA